MISIQGKTVIVTGASRGIGRAIAIGFAQAGANLVLNSRSDSKELGETIKLINEVSDASCIKVCGSVSEKDVAEELTSSAVAEFGSLDILINNAGVARDTPLMLMRDDDWKQVIDTNLTGVFECTRAAVRPMMQQRSGRIISISSISAISGRSGQSNYAAAKAGVIGFTKSITRELGRYNILTNALMIGLVNTEMTRKIPREQFNKMKSGISIGRIGDPEEVVGPCLFLASDMATYITGSVINVSGGSYI